MPIEPYIVADTRNEEWLRFLTVSWGHRWKSLRACIDDIRKQLTGATWRLCSIPHRIGFPLRLDQIVNATDLTDSLMVHVDAVVVCIDLVWEQKVFSKLSENTAQALANYCVHSPAEPARSGAEGIARIRSFQ
jgi:hypothetical protein